MLLYKFDLEVLYLNDNLYCKFIYVSADSMLSAIKKLTYELDSNNLIKEYDIKSCEKHCKINYIAD